MIKENPKLTTNLMPDISVDTVLNVGVYSVTKAIGTTKNGFPVNADGTLFVDRIANNSRLQIFYTLSPVRMFIRTKNISFVGWVEVATKADISNEVKLQSERLASEKIKEMYSTPDIDLVTANNYAVATEDLKGGFKLLISKNHTSKKAPASMTKVLTAITALEQGVPISEEFTVVQEDIVAGSGYNLKAGDIITFEDLLYDMMLPSSNIAANCVARVIGDKIGGGTEKFIEKMNQKCSTLGMSGSTFFNASSLGQSGQVTTCEDMAKLGLYAIKNSELSRIWGGVREVNDNKRA